MAEANLIAMATRLINKWGRDFTFYEGEGTDDPDKPWRASEIEPPSIVDKMVVEEYGLADIDGDIVRRGDLKGYTRLLGETNPHRFVQAKDSRDNTSWRIVNVKPIQPGATTIVYELQLRQ